MCEGLRNTKNKKKKADPSGYIMVGPDSEVKFIQVQIPALFDGCNYIIKVYDFVNVISQRTESNSMWTGLMQRFPQLCLLFS